VKPPEPYLNLALLQLRLALADKAKTSGLEPDVDSVFAALQTQFGLSAIDARVHLQRLKHDPRTYLQELAAKVKRLSPVNREWYTFDTFVQLPNDLGLHHQFLVIGVKTVEDALQEGEAYLLAAQLHRSRLSSRQVKVEVLEDHPKPESTAHVAVAAVSPPPNSQVIRMTEMVEKLVAALAQSTTVRPAQRPQRSKPEPPQG